MAPPWTPTSPVGAEGDTPSMRLRCTIDDVWHVITGRSDQRSNPCTDASTDPSEQRPDPYGIAFIPARSTERLQRHTKTDTSTNERADSCRVAGDRGNADFDDVSTREGRLVSALGDFDDKLRFVGSHNVAFAEARARDGHDDFCSWHERSHPCPIRTG